MIAWLAIALAEPAAPGTALDIACLGPRLVSSAPAPNATDVPWDIVPALVFHAECGGGEPMDLRLTDRGTGEVLVATSGGAELVTQLHPFLVVELPLEAPLRPDTVYEVRAQSWLGEPTSITFTTGSRQVEPSVGLPELFLDRAHRDREHGGWIVEADIEVEPSSAEGGLVVVREGGAARAILDQPGPGPFEAAATWWTDAKPRPLCLSAIERGPRGDWLGPSAEVCAPARRGCDAGGVGAGSALLLALGALSVRRRRR